MNYPISYWSYRNVDKINSFIVNANPYLIVGIGVTLGCVIFIPYYLKIRSRNPLSAKSFAILATISIILSLLSIFLLRHLYKSLNDNSNEVCRTGSDKLKELYRCKNGEMPDIDEEMNEFNKFMYDINQNRISNDR